MKFALVFPGQGSQSVGMMNGFAGAEARRTFDEASAALGEDLWRMVCEGPAELLGLTVNTQPVMLAAGVAAFRSWRAAGGPLPAVMAGHSLGEYSALVAAGSIGFQDAVRLVRLRAEAMQRAVPEGSGAMAALLGLDDDRVLEVCREAAQGEVLEAANFNSPAQVVIAGQRAAVERGIELAKARGAKRAVMLAMSAPSHCSLMHPAAGALREALARVSIVAPEVPVLHNVDVAPRVTPEAIREALVQQLVSPVRWVDTVRACAAQGVAAVLECGPGKVLMGLNKRIEGGLQNLALADDASLAEALAAVAS